MTIKNTIHVTLAATLLAVALTAHGAFFMRIKSSAAKALESGSLVERSDAIVNGKKATIGVYAFDKAPADAAADIARALPEGWGGGMWLSRTEDGVRRDIVVMPGLGAGESTVWLVESDASGGQPAIGANIIPGSDLKSQIEIKRNGCTMSVHDLQGSPEAAMAAATAAMQGLGWETLLSSGRTAFFAKGGKCAVVSAFQRGGMTRVAVLR